MSYNQNGYISPQQLVQAPSSNGHRRSSHATTHGYKPIDPGNLTPGSVHVIPYQPNVSPQMILNGYQTQAHQTRFFLFARAKEHCGCPSVESITFSVQGELGPYIKDLMKRRVVIDKPHDYIFQEFGWKRTTYVMDANGIVGTPERLRTSAPDGSPLTREMLSLELCSVIFQFFTKNPAVSRMTDWRGIRLVALSYYRNVWVPILAIDA